MKKTNKLVDVIKEAVRAVVREELKEALGEKTLTKENIQHGINLVDLQDTPKNPHEQGTQAPKREDFTFSKDPVLNKILNETAAAKDEWKTLGNKTYSREDAMSGLASKMGYGDMQPGGKPTAQQMIPRDRQHVQVDSNLEKALTRDYRDLVKAFDKKKKK